MIWLTLVILTVSKLLNVSALECFHMNKYGVSKLVTCRGYCASISAVVANNNLAEVNYCVPERRCLAELDSRQLTDMGSLICRGLIDSAGPGAITRCRAAVCQSDGCNNYNFRTDPEMNDCSLHQCSNAACHNPEELLTTVEPPGSSTYATATTPFVTDDQKIITAEPEQTTPGSPDGEVTAEEETVKWETTGATTAGNEITTKVPVVTPVAEVETEKPSTEIAPSTDHSEILTEKPPTEPKEQTTAKVESIATTTILTEEPEIITDKPTTPEKNPTTAKPEPTTAKPEPTPEPTVIDVKVNVTDEQPTLDDFDTKTRGPPLVKTDFKETGTTSYPPTVAEVTTDDGGATTEVAFESTEFSEVVTIGAETGTKDQRTTDVVDITRTPNRSTKFKNFIGSSTPPNQDENDGFMSNNSIDVEMNMEITNRDTIVRADANSSAISASYLSLSLIFLVSALSVL